MPPTARLGDAPHLQLLHEPAPRLDIKPRHVLQQGRPEGAWDRLRRALRGGGGAVAVHVLLAGGFVYLLSFRDVDLPRTVEIPVEVVVEAPKPRAAPSGADRLRQALAAPAAPAPDPHPPGPPQVQPPPTPSGAQAAAPQPTQSQATPPTPSAAPEPPKLVAPPPEPTHAAARDRADKAANLAPVGDAEDRAKREAKPVEVPRALATADPRASFAVPLPAPPQSRTVDDPAPPIPAKEPSATEKLAAALAVDTSAMPASFRAVLSGNGAQVSAAYKGVVFGRFNRHPEIAERARDQHLKGQVIVAFTIDDGGGIEQIKVLQSSGDPAVDALGLEMIRASAPFPPPPPEAQRSFTPALAFGP